MLCVSTTAAVGELARNTVPSVRVLNLLDKVDGVYIVHIADCRITPGSYPVVGLNIRYQLLDTVRGVVGEGDRAFFWVNLQKSWHPRVGDKAIYMFNGPSTRPTSAVLLPYTDATLKRVKGMYPQIEERTRNGSSE